MFAIDLEVVHKLIIVWPRARQIPRKGILSYVNLMTD